MAHPGRTASDGCHYCRTNCAKWGEREGARHCHNANKREEIDIPAPRSVIPDTPLAPTSDNRCAD